MTDSTSPAFVSNLPVNCLDHAATYTFYQPVVDRVYCNFVNHTIIDIQVNGSPYPSAVWFTETCAPNATNPSCSSVSIDPALVNYTNTITFIIQSSIIKRNAPHNSSLVTLDLNCRDSSHTFMTSHIVPPSYNLTLVQFVTHFYTFTAQNFTCNCPTTIFCQTITYTTVNDTSGQLPNPVYNGITGQWEIAILYQELLAVNFSIQATTSYGVNVTSEVISFEIIDNCLYDNITLNAS